MALIVFTVIVTREKSGTPAGIAESGPPISEIPPVPADQPAEAASDRTPEAPAVPEMHPGAISGRLFGRDGSPGVDIEISAQLLPPDGSAFANEALSPPVVAEPDERGAFYFDKLPFGSYVVQAQADGQIARASCRLSREAPVADVLLILQGADGISGRVVDSAGAGVRGAAVFPLLLDGQERQSSAVLADATVANGQGAFALPWLEAGTWTFQARAPGFAPTISTPIATGTHDAVIQLEPGVHVAGRTTDGGEPAADVKVTLATVGMKAPALAVTSDAEGAFVFEAVPPGDYLLRGEKAGRIVKDAPIQIAVANTPHNGLLLELVDGGVLRGRVSDRDSGEGISGVVVRALREGEGRLRLVSAPSDAQGRFEVAGLDPGAYELVADEAPGYSRYGRNQSAVYVAIAAGETLEGISIALSRGVVISGHVVDAQGEPVGGADVHGRVRGWQDRQSTGKDGAFTLSRLNGGETIRVMASTTSAKSKEYTFDIPPAGLSGVKLVLEHAADGLIAGVVVDRRSQPFHGRVSLALADEGSHRTTNRTNTDAEGRFLFASVAAGAYKIGARTESGIGRELLRLTMKPGQQVRGLRLVFDEDASLEISGKVTNESGAPVAALLTLDRLRYPGSAAQSTGSTAVDGTFRFRGLDEGFFRITASAPGYAEVNVDDIPSGTQDLSIVMPGGLTISGTVVSSENIPITEFEAAVIHTGVSVYATAFIQSPFKHFSNPEGAFSLEVDEGRYDVIARAPGFAMGRARVGAVGSGAGAEGVLVVLEKHPPVSGRVIDSEGRPVVGAAIFLGELPGGAEYITDFAAAYSGAEGRFEIGAPELERGFHLSVFHRTAGFGEVFTAAISSEPLEIQLAPREPAWEADSTDTEGDVGN